MTPYFEIIGEISGIEIIAVERSIGDIRRIRRLYGKGRWRKLKGTARVRFKSGIVRLAELHWYEAHGIGKCEVRIKRYLDRRV
jgi:hypothetical protein